MIIKPGWHPSAKSRRALPMKCAHPLRAVKGLLQLLQAQSPHHYIAVAQQELESAISLPNDGVKRQ